MSNSKNISNSVSVILREIANIVDGGNSGSAVNDIETDTVKEVPYRLSDDMIREMVFTTESPIRPLMEEISKVIEKHLGNQLSSVTLLKITQELWDNVETELRNSKNEEHAEFVNKLAGDALIQGAIKRRVDKSLSVAELLKNEILSEDIPTGIFGFESTIEDLAKAPAEEEVVQNVWNELDNLVSDDIESSRYDYASEYMLVPEIENDPFAVARTLYTEPSQVPEGTIFSDAEQHIEDKQALWMNTGKDIQTLVTATSITIEDVTTSEQFNLLINHFKLQFLPEINMITGVSKNKKPYAIRLTSEKSDVVRMEYFDNGVLIETTFASNLQSVLQFIFERCNKNSNKNSIETVNA